MNETFSRFIQLVIQNNPTAISQKLMAIGVLNQEMEDAEYIRQMLYDQVRRIGEDGSELILQVLDVPLNPEGFGATKLMNFYATAFAAKRKKHQHQGIFYGFWDNTKKLRLLEPSGDLATEVTSEPTIIEMTTKEVKKATGTAVGFIQDLTAPQVEDVLMDVNETNRVFCCFFCWVWIGGWSCLVVSKAIICYLKKH